MILHVRWFSTTRCTNGISLTFFNCRSRWLASLHLYLWKIFNGHDHKILVDKQVCLRPLSIKHWQRLAIKYFIRFACRLLFLLCVTVLNTWFVDRPLWTQEVPMIPAVVAWTSKAERRLRLCLIISSFLIRFSHYQARRLLVFPS